MADYKTHLTGGVCTGVAAALLAAGSGLVAPGLTPIVGGVAVVGGLAPDVDSDTSRPARILSRLAAVVLPTAAVRRVAWLHAAPEQAVIVWILLALAVLYPGAWLFKKFTVHRGIFHSLPAIGIFGCAAFLLTGRRIEDVELQIAVGLAGAAGYLTHLLLDELWSVDFNGARFVKKRSFGTALSPFGVAWPSTIAAWALLFALAGLVAQGLEGVAVEDLLGSRGGPLADALLGVGAAAVEALRGWLR